MRFVYFIICLILTVALIIVLDKPLGPVPPLGRFISPQHGFWQNAEPVEKNFSSNINFPSLSNSVDVYFDQRMVPHVFAQDETDASFVQGYLHAKFRLWQMEFQTMPRRDDSLKFWVPDQTVLILITTATCAVLEWCMERKDPLSKLKKTNSLGKMVSAYTDGVNSYIEQMTASDLPLEYRLLNYSPEKWTNLKTALFLKYMSYDLTGFETDIEYTNAKSFFSEEDYNKLYPLLNSSADPIVPRGSYFSPPSRTPVQPATADSLYFLKKAVDTVVKINSDTVEIKSKVDKAGSKIRKKQPPAKPKAKKVVQIIPKAPALKNRIREMEATTG